MKTKVFNKKLMLNKMTAANLTGSGLMRFFWIAFFLVTVLQGATIFAFAQGTEGDSRVRVQVLYINNETGYRYLEGVREAIADRKAEKLVNLLPESYENEDDGVRKLLEAIAEKKIDIIMGPTESGVFARALRQSKGADANPIPVISSLVAGDIGQDHTSWFFRTNVDVTKRAYAIFDVLQKRSISSAAVFYEDTEFGRRAEEAFRNQLENKWPKANYLPLPFSSTADAREAVDKVLKKRTESVGIFAKREYITKIIELFKAQDSGGIRYKPFLFTVLDVRLIKDQLDDIYFVSVTKPQEASFTITGRSLKNLESKGIPGNVIEKLKGLLNRKFRGEAALLEALLNTIGDEQTAAYKSLILTHAGNLPDDIKCLSYDTTILILDILEELPMRPLDNEVFRSRFAAVLAGGVAPKGKVTGMWFINFENNSRADVYRLYKENIELIPHNQVVEWWRTPLIKIKLLYGRFGYKPFGIAIMLVILSILTTWLDIKRWYLGETKSIRHNCYFYLLIGFNAFLVLGLYIFLAETGRIQWDGCVTALMIALAPSAILKSTWFETPSGKQIGLIHYYNKLLIFINDKLMVEKYKSQQAHVNVIVYYNSLPFLTKQLEHLYGSARTPERRETLKNSLTEELEGAGNLENKRRICAIRLMSRLKWAELVQKSCVPKSYENKDDVEDPIVLIKEGVNNCLKYQIGTKDLEIYIRKRLESCSEASSDHYQRKLDEEETSSERGRLYIQVIFIFLTFYRDISKDEDAESLKKEIEALKAS